MLDFSRLFPHAVDNLIMRAGNQGVRQLAIRSQTTKDKVGTLPLYAYSTPTVKEDHEYVNMEMDDIFKGQNTPQLIARFAKNSILCVKTQREVRLCVVSIEVTDDDRLIQAKWLENTERDVTSFHQAENTIIHLTEVVEVLSDMRFNEEGVLNLTIEEYENLFQTPSDDENDEIDEPLVQKRVTGVSRGNRRQTRVPSYLNDYVN